MQIVTSQPNQQETVFPQAKDVKFGQPFSFAQWPTSKGPIYIRVKPTGFLLNSTVIGDVLNRGDILTVNLTKNTLYYMKGDTPVVLRDAHVVVTDQQSVQP